MPRTSGQFEELRSQRIELIEQAALKCFSLYGFHNTSITVIAKEAGISNGLMYNYFTGKGELLRSIFLKGMERVLSPLEVAGELTKDDFEKFITDLFAEVQSNASFWKLYFIVMTQPDVLDEHREYMLKIVLPVRNALTAYFRREGRQQPDVDTSLLFSMLDGIYLNYLIDPDHYPLDAIKQQILKFYEY